MSLHVIDIAAKPCRISFSNKLLVIEQGEGESATVPLSEIGVVLLSSPQSVCTHGALSALGEAGVPLVVCGSNRHPNAIMLPAHAHHRQAERLRDQVNATKPTLKRCWQQVVRAKIAGQAAVLHRVQGFDAGIKALIPQVKSGDPQNVEARAARAYWSSLFPNEGFKRDRDAHDANRFLNYGYAVIRAIVARAIAASGLHPSLGLHHRNQSNPFNLADDLIEPFRPWVDYCVSKLCDEVGSDAAFEPSVKHMLMEFLLVPIVFGEERREPFDCAHRIAHSLWECYSGARQTLALPNIAQTVTEGG